MSQVDIGAGAPFNRVSKGGIGFESSALGLAATLGAPGLVPEGPESRGVTLARELAAAVGAGVQATQAATDYQLKVRAVEYRNADTLQALDAGHGVELAKGDLPDLLLRIDSGQIKAADGAKLDEVAGVLVDEKVNGLPTATQAAYRSTALPRLASALYARQEVERVNAARFP